MPFLFLKNYWRSIIIFVIILILTSVTFTSVPNVARFKNSDKVVHILMFLGLGLVLAYDYLKDQDLKLKINKWKWYLLLFGILFGGLIEIIQKYLTTTRTAELLDWVADIIGLGLGFIFAVLLNKLLTHFKTNH